MTLKRIFKKTELGGGGWGARTGLIWLTAEKFHRLLCTR